MSDSPEPTPSVIIGDVVATAEVRVNTKGGSMTATLKKPIRERLGEIGSRLVAAAVEFTAGQPVLLLSPGASAGSLPLRVRRVSERLFEIELGSGEEDEVDEVTAAFLRLKQSRFVTDDLDLAPPVSGDQWRAEMDGKTAHARRAVQARTAKAAAQ